MTRHTKIGLVVGFAFILITTPIGLLSGSSSTWNCLGQVLTLPALPVVYVLVQIFPPPMGESEITPWDYFMMTVGILVSALIYGLVAGFVSRYFRAKPNDAADKPDRANRRQPLGFREPVGEVDVRALMAAAAHPGRSA